jgi:hypothetical protein
MLVLTALCKYGRIVALQECLRGYRIAADSEGQRIIQAASPFDLLMLSLSVRLAVLRRAWLLRVPFAEHLELIGLAVRNLFRTDFGQSTDFCGLAMVRGAEWVALRDTISARTQVVRQLQQEITKRQKIVRDLGRDSRLFVRNPGVQEPELYASASIRERLDRVRGEHPSLLRLFRPPPMWQVALCRELNEDIGRLRRLCDEQLEIINQLDAEARALLQIIEGTSDP